MNTKAREGLYVDFDQERAIRHEDVVRQPRPVWPDLRYAWTVRASDLAGQHIKENGDLLPNSQRQRRTCYALCYILYPVAAAHTNLVRMDSSPTSPSQHVSLSGVMLALQRAGASGGGGQETLPSSSGPSSVAPRGRDRGYSFTRRRHLAGTAVGV